MIDSEEYCEGKVKKHSIEWILKRNWNLKLIAIKVQENWIIVYLLHNGSAS